jgi:hypothetical protein
MVLFGGSTQKGISDETWTWDGHGWTHVHPAISPPARASAAMAYDAARHRVVLVGGMGSEPTGKGMVELRDTWTWDGSSWTQEHPTLQPPAIQSMPMAYDPVSHLVIAFYADMTSDHKPHTLGWDGKTWQELFPPNQPNSTAQGTLVSDGVRPLFVGMPFGQVGGRYLAKTWAWEGRDWHQLKTGNSPPNGVSAAVFDGAHRQIVGLNMDTWTFDGSTWTRQHPTSAPTGAPYMAYFPKLKKVLAWGDRYSSQSGDVWAWDGSNWTLLEAGPPLPTPPNKFAVQGTMSPADADTTVRKTADSVRPVLTPGYLPEGMEAQVMAGSSFYSIVYQSDQRDKRISLDILAPNPAPGNENTFNRTVVFRGVTATYQVDDRTSPLSRRWLMWNEPGTIANSPSKASGVPYFLSTEGITDAEFWQVAQSLR